MWPGGGFPGYRAALAAPHTWTSRVEVWTGGGSLLLADLPIESGEVRATLTNRVTRTAKFVTDETLFPWADDGLLAPFGNEIHAFRGIEYGDGSTVEFPVFVGRIQRAKLRPEGSVEVLCVDYAGDVVDAQFERPENANTANRILAEVQRLIAQGRAGAVFGLSDDIQDPVPPLTWETDRGQALDDLAKVGGAFWYSRANGEFVLRRIPWAQPAPPVSTVDLILADGPGGLVESSTVERARDGVFNAVTVVSERLDGSEPAGHTARDLTAGSPTYYFGPFGKRPVTYSIPSAQAQPQCVFAAESYLARLKSFTATWEVTMPPDASIELGDVARIVARDHDVLQVVASYTMPLATTGAMGIQFRAITPGVI